MNDVDAEAAALRTALRLQADPARAGKLESYLKSPLYFHGVTVAAIRAQVRTFRRGEPDPGAAALQKLVLALRDTRYHEERTMAIILLESYPRYLDAAAMPLLESLLEDCGTWDHVDALATIVVGRVIEKDSSVLEYLPRWAGSDSFWMRRAALIAKVRVFRRGGGDVDMFPGFAGDMIEEREFFIRKAIGWSLRELSRSRPDTVYEFLLSVRDRSSGLTLREGSRRLPAKQRAELMGR